MKILIVLLAVLLLGCRSTSVKVEYRIPNAYHGLCMIFIYKESGDLDSNHIVINKQGLSRISERNVRKKFVLLSDETRSEIPIIQIGNEINALDSTRYIFRLSKDVSSSSCDKIDIKLLSFYVGYKEEYLKWSDKYHNDFEYFSSIGVNWCKYYKQLK